MSLIGSGTFMLSPEDAGRRGREVLKMGYFLVDTGAACVRERAAGRASGKAVCPERRSSFPPGPGAPRSFSFDPETRMKTSWEGGGRRSGHHRKLNTFKGSGTFICFSLRIQANVFFYFTQEDVR